MTAEVVEMDKTTYEKMLEEMDRMKETIEVLSDQETVRELRESIERIESGEYYTEKEFFTKSIK